MPKFNSLLASLAGELRARSKFSSTFRCNSDFGLLCFLIFCLAPSLLGLDSATAVAHSEPAPTLLSPRAAVTPIKSDKFNVVNQFASVLTAAATSVSTSDSAATPFSLPGPAPSSCPTPGAAPAPPIIADVGLYEFATADYKFPAALDSEVLTHAATELWARVFWPKDLSRPRPIIFLLHGNHATCGKLIAGGVGREDLDCTYTAEGSCPNDMVVVPNHEGYNYLGEHFASHGFIAVSINANRGITCGDGNDEDFGLNLARGRLILRHIQLWDQWSKIGGLPASFGLNSKHFVGAVDLKEVGLFGHSRGGEGARAAFHLYREQGSPWQSRIPEVEFRAIFEIGAVDGQTKKDLDADGVAWNQLLPMCDGDVSDLQGRLPFERMITKDSESRATQKSLTYVWGANHNFFNTEWLDPDSFGCKDHELLPSENGRSKAQQKIAVATAGAFFRAHLGSRRRLRLARLFDPLAPLNPVLSSMTRMERDHLATFDASFVTKLEDFTAALGVNSVSGEPNIASGIRITHASTSISAKGQRLASASVRWQAADSMNFLQIHWNRAGEGFGILPLQTIDFRVADASRGTSPQYPVDFSIALVDSNGNLSVALPVSRFGIIDRPGHSEKLYQTIRIRTSEFGLPNGTKVRGARFTFDRTAKAAINIAHLRLSTDDRLGLRRTRNHPLTPLDATSQPSTMNSTAPVDINGAPTNTQDRDVDARELESTPHPVSKTQSEALFVGSKGVTRSKYLNGRSGLEITIRTKEGIFPVAGQLPKLILAEKIFAVSRYANHRRLDTLVFSVPMSDFKQLPANGRMLVRYGDEQSIRVWQLSDYQKSRLSN